MSLYYKNSIKKEAIKISNKKNKAIKKVKKVLMCTFSYWDTLTRVGSHHYANQFLKNGYKVFFLSDFFSPILFMSFKHFNLKIKKFKLWMSGGEIKANGNLISYNPLVLLYPKKYLFLNSHIILKYLINFSFPNLLTKLKQYDFLNVDILWYDNPSYAILSKYINTKKTILRVADDTAAFKGISKGTIIYELKAGEIADLVITPSYPLFIRYSKLWGNKVQYIRNGVDLNHFSRSFLKPKDYKNIQKPIILYVGVIEYWFDIDLLLKLANRFPTFSFIIIGPTRINFPKSIYKAHNIYLLGHRSYNMIPAYMQWADVGIIPFKASESLIPAVNPLKLYEYFASGLQVVATKWKELEIMKSPALLANNHEEFLKLLLKAVNQKLDKKSSFKFLKDSDWKNKFKRIIDFLYL